MKKVNQELINVRATTIKKTSRDKSIHYDFTGMTETGSTTIERTHYIPGEKRTYRQTYQCNCCGYSKQDTATYTSEI